MSKNDLTIEIYFRVEIADTTVRMNRSICWHGTHCLRQEQIDVIAPCEQALRVNERGRCHNEDEFRVPERVRRE